MKPFIVIFEGMDKTGKTTLKEEFNKITKFKHFVIDRGPISNIVYNKLLRHNADNNMFFYEVIDHLSKLDHLIVFCTAHKQDINDRLKANNEVLPRGTTIDQTQKLFHDEITRSLFSYVAINTSEDSVVSCVYKIIDHIFSLSATTNLYV